MNHKEIWKDIVEYEGLYQVSDKGRIKSMLRKFVNGDIILKAGLAKRGYLTVALHKNKKQKSYKVHRLVACAFVINDEEKSQVNHKNSIKTDNSACNLEWCTNSENQLHRHRYGNNNTAMQGRRGSECPNSKPVIRLTPNNVFVKEYVSQTYASMDTGIHRAAISSCCNGHRKKAGGYKWKFKQQL